MGHKSSPSKSDKPGAPAVDGRKRRWQEHKLARREELVDGTLAAIRLRGSDIGMDEIAAEIGVSKTVLYRYFADKSDLTSAATIRFMQTRLAPALAEALAQDLDEFELTKAAISTYVRTVADEPEIYPFVMGMTSSSSAGVQDAVAKSERLIAEMLSQVLGEHLRQRGMDSGGAEPWAYAVVGGIQLATHRWMTNKTMTVDALIDYLVMFGWSAIQGIADANGSPSVFNAAPHPLVTTPSGEAAPAGEAASWEAEHPEEHLGDGSGDVAAAEEFNGD